MDEEATSEAPPRRRTSWSLKTIVEDVAGRPISDLQDPSRPVHPYLRGRVDPPTSTDLPGARGEEPYDPVAHLYPPLVGPTGREFHGPDREHHSETLERHRPEAAAPGSGGRPPGPSHRPERLYLHYLLLHMDRLSDSALRYLRAAVEEETAHRARPLPAPAPKPAAAPEAPALPPEAPPPAA